MKRRDLFKSAGGGLVGAGLMGCSGISSGRAASARARKPLIRSQDSKLPPFRLETLTHGPKHHFFGYYGMCPWNKSQSRLICLESDFQDHLPKPGEPGAVGLVDQETGEFKQVGETRAWNLQQGALIHWNPLDPENEVVFNDRAGDRLLASVLNVETGVKRHLPQSISAVSRAGDFALSLTYGRLTRLRGVVGYVGAEDPNPDDPRPKNDGVFRMDLKTGKTSLIISVDEIYEDALKRYPPLKGKHMWFNHTVLSRNDKRLFFLARFKNSGLDSAMYSVNVDGSDLRICTPWGGRVSHFDWRNDEEIVATFSPGKDMERGHYLFHDGQGDYRQVGKDFIFGTGHCTFSPRGDWMATDGSAATLVKEKRYFVESLEIFNVETGQGVFLGMFNQGDRKFNSGNVRCDLHPRWNRTGDAVCFDSMDTSNWTRQLHVAYLGL